MILNNGHVGGSSGIDTGIDTGDIGHSLRFRRAASAYLNRTFGAPTANTSWALSLFVKRGELSTVQSIFSAGDSDLRYTVTTDTITLTKDTVVVATSSSVQRDPSSHTHLFIRSNGTDIKLYVNAVEVFSYTGTIPNLNSAIAHTIGKYAGAASKYFDGYMSRIAFVDNGGSLTPQDFVYLNTEINEWVTKSQSQVKAVVDAGGTNSFMLDFDDATSLTTLGYDKSSKGNNWTLNNFSLTAGATYDHMLDVPGNSYCTLNPLDNAGIISNGNLYFSNGASARSTRSSLVIPENSDIYFEGTVLTTTSGSIVAGLGIGTAATSLTANLNNGSTTGFYGVTVDNFQVNAVNGAAGSITAKTIAAGTVLQIAASSRTGKVWYGIENVWYDTATTTIGDPSAGTNPSATVACSGFSPMACCYNESLTLNFGQRPFAHTPPTGFKALCQRNLDGSGVVTISGTFTGNLNVDGPYVWMNGTPKTLTINGNAVTFGTHADKLATGFKVRSASASYNASGSNTWTATIDSDIQNIFKYNNAEGNP